MKKLIIAVLVLTVAGISYAGPTRERRSYHHAHRRASYDQSGVALASDIVGLVANGIAIIRAANAPIIYEVPVYRRPARVYGPVLPLSNELSAEAVAAPVFVAPASGALYRPVVILPSYRYRSGHYGRPVYYHGRPARPRR